VLHLQQFLSEGAESCEKGEDGGEGSSIAPGEIVVVGVEEIVPAPAIYGEDLTNILYKGRCQSRKKCLN